MALATLKRGGAGRFVLKNVQPMDSFVLPPGVRVHRVIAENTLTTGKNLNVQTFTFTSGTAGTTAVTFDGVNLFTAASETYLPFTARFAQAFVGGVTGTTGITWYAYAATGNGVVYVYSKPTRLSRTTGLVVGGGVGTVGGLTGVVTTPGVAGTNALGGTPAISIGTAAPSLPIQTFTVTAGVSAAGVIQVDGVPVAVAATDTTTALVAAKLAAANLAGASNGPWTATLSGSTVTLTGVTPRVATAVTVAIVSGATDFTVGTVSVVQAGLTSGTGLVNAQAIPLGGSASNADLTIAGLNWRAATALDKVVYTFAGTASASSGVTLYIGNVIVTNSSGTSATNVATDVTAKLNTVPGYYATSSSGAVTLTITDSQKTIPQVSFGTMTGVTVTTVTTPAALPHYVTFTGPTTAGMETLAIGNVDLYIQTEKFM